MQYNFDLIKQKLKDRDFKLTPQRRCILDIIIENKGKHLSTEEIYEMVKIKCPEIGLATVYRTMQIFEGIDLVYKHNFDDGRSRYELNNDEDHQHHHLICKKCGNVIEVEEDLLEQLEKQVETNYGFCITNHNLKFMGYCKNCRP